MSQRARPGVPIRPAGPLGRLAALSGLSPTAIRLALLGVLLVPSGCIAALYFAGESTDDHRPSRVEAREAPEETQQLQVGSVAVEYFLRDDGRVCTRVDPEFGGDFSCHSNGRFGDAPVTIEFVAYPGGEDAVAFGRAPGVVAVTALIDGASRRGDADTEIGIYAVPFEPGMTELRVERETSSLSCSVDPAGNGPFLRACE